MEWCEKYVGLHFKEKGRDWTGVDCYGLVYLVYLHERQLVLPRYEDDYASVEDHAEIAAALETGCLVNPHWRLLATDEVDACFDVIILRIRGLPIHCALVTASGWMLHSLAGMDCAIERYHTPLWTRRRVGTYRYCPDAD